MRLLTGKELRSAVEKITMANPVACAVAFWGRGAESLFSATNYASTRIICNLSMGGTNPKVIDALMIAGIAVRQCDFLHAKVYIGMTEAVVTSANASINGLGLEQPEATWIEVGVIVPASDVMPWFEDLWTRCRSVIRPQNIDAALTEFAKRRMNFIPVVPSDFRNQLESPADELDVSAPDIDQAGRFFGKSLAEAALFILARERRPMRIREISDELAQEGVLTAAAHLSNSVR